MRAYMYYVPFEVLWFLKKQTKLRTKITGFRMKLNIQKICSQTHVNFEELTIK